MSPAVVTIDGPAAAGKSTTAQRVAHRLGYLHVNTGVLYRAVTWAALRDDWIDDREEYPQRLRELELELDTSDGPRVLVGGDEPGEELQGPEVSERVSEVSALAPVRGLVNTLLQAESEDHHLVCDGRDMGTAVFPEAPLKIYLTADSEERARRRLVEYGEDPSPEQIQEEAARLQRRDDADSTRELAPLEKADDAVEVDTTDLAPHEVVDRIVELARRRGLPEAG